MLTYSQTTGKLAHNGAPMGIGWAGNGAGKNNPDMQGEHNVGPLPRGNYTLEAPVTHPKLGQLAFKLTPQTGTDMLGRDGMWLHGPSKNPKKFGQESEGCIIMVHEVREALVPLAGETVQVVE